MRTLGVIAVVGLALGPSAHGATGLSWSLDEPVRYVINSQTIVSSVFQMNAEENLDRRVLEWKLNLNVLCTRTAAGKSGVEVTCTLEDVSVAADPFRDDEADMQLVVDEWDKVLTGATAQLRVGSDGRITSFDLDNIQHTRNNDRIRRIQEQMRLAVGRAFAGLDLQLPSKGDDKGKAWPSKSSMFMDIPSPDGTAGGLEIVSKVVEQKGSEVVIETTGTGVRGPARYNEAGQIQNAWDLRMFSRATFDTAAHRLVAREVMVQGDLTPSSQIATSGAVGPYVQAVKVTLVPAGETVEPFGPNQVL